jgi:chromosomal replication initiator protein
MYLCRDLTSHSLPTIGEAFGKNHATILHACRLISKKEQEEPEIRQALTSLRENLTRPATR